jgi:hypothetical protein
MSFFGNAPDLLRTAVKELIQKAVEVEFNEFVLAFSI